MCIRDRRTLADFIPTNLLHTLDSPTTAKPPPAKKPSPRKVQFSSPKPVNTETIRNDRLGTLVNDLLMRHDQAESWSQFALDFRGPSYLSENLEALDHPATLSARGLARQRCPRPDLCRTVVRGTKRRMHQPWMPPLSNRAQGLHTRRDGRVHHQPCLLYTSDAADE